MSATWYYSHAGQVNGPIRTDELKRQAALGVLKPSDLIWPSNVDHQLAVEAGAALDFPALKATMSALPDWLGDVEKAETLQAASPRLPSRPPPEAPAWLGDIQRLLHAPSSKPSPIPSWMLDFEPAEKAAKTQLVPSWLAPFLPQEPPPSSKP